MKKKVFAVATAAVLLCAMPFAAQAEEQTYPSDADDYKAMVAEYPDYYRIQDDSVYFLEHSLMGETDFVISSDALSTVEYVDFGYVFTPEEDGRYVIVLEETIQDGAVEGDFVCEFEYKNKHTYIADVENGVISVSYEGSSDGKTDFDDTPCSDDRDYYSYVNGELPGHYDRYITTVYSYHGISSYFCLNSGYTDGLLGTDVTTSDNTVAYCGIQMGVASSLTTDDVQALSIVRAVSDGEAFITLNDEWLFYVSVENGIFRRTEEIMTVLPTDPEASYEPLGVLSFGSLPDQRAYDIGEPLDLTGLTVSLDYYYGADGHESIYSNVSPLDYPDAFIVDTSDFDSTNAGTYEIRVSCTPETGMTYWAIETISFEVFVGDYISDPVDTCTVTIDQLPDKTNYSIGEALDLTGTVVSADYRSVFTGNVSYDHVLLTDNLGKFVVDDSAFDSTVSGTYTIYITYFGSHTHDTVSFDVTVSEQTLLSGDVNGDGKFSILDIIHLQKYLLSAGNLTTPQNADMCADGVINAFDLAMMKRELVAQNANET